MQKKRGAAHLEMVIAFLLFIGFVAFLFTIIKPYDNTTLSQAVLEGMSNTLEEQTKTNYTQAFLELNDGIGGGQCYNLTLPQELFSQGLTKVRVKDLGGNDVEADFVEGKLFLLHTAQHYRLTISPDLTEYGTVSSCVPATDYNIGSVINKQIISLKKIELMETQYFTDYEGLKNTLKVPGIYDYAIILEDSNIKMEKIIPDTGEILSKEFVMELLDYNTGEIKNQRITIKIW